MTARLEVINPQKNRKELEERMNKLLVGLKNSEKTKSEVNKIVSELCKDAENLYIQCNYSGSKTCYETALKINPESQKANYKYAQLLLSLRNDNFFEEKQFLKHINKVIEINPEHIGAYNSMAIYYLNKGQYDKSIEYIDKCIQIDTKNEYLYLSNMGFIYYTMGECDKSIELLEKAAFIISDKEKSSESIEKISVQGIFYNLAYFQYAKGIETDKKEYFNKSKVNFKKAIKYGMRSPDLYNNLGKSYEKLENFNEAIKCYFKSCKLFPDDFNSWFNAGDLLYKAHEYEFSYINFNNARMLAKSSEDAMQASSMCNEISHILKKGTDNLER